jgi:hypothetical protein
MEQQHCPDFGKHFERCANHCEIADECRSRTDFLRRTCKVELHRLGFKPDADLYQDEFFRLKLEAQERHPDDPERRDSHVKYWLKRWANKQAELEAAKQKRAHEQTKRIKSSLPSGRARFPYKWMEEGMRQNDLMALFGLIRKCRKPDTDRIVEELVAKGCEREIFFEGHVLDEHGDPIRSGIYPVWLFTFPYEAAEKELGWSHQKSYRLLRRAVEEGLLLDPGYYVKPKRTRVYIAGHWMKLEGLGWTPRFRFHDDRTEECRRAIGKGQAADCDGCPEPCRYYRAFRDFKASGFNELSLFFKRQHSGGRPKKATERKYDDLAQK